MMTNAEFLAIRDFNRTIDQSTAEAERIINKKNRELNALQVRIQELEAALVAKQCAVVGLTAQAKAFVAAYPDSHLLKPTGKLYKGGRKQTVVGKVFDAAFDQKAIELGHKNPSSMRDVAVDLPDPGYTPRR